MVPEDAVRSNSQRLGIGRLRIDVEIFSLFLRQKDGRVVG